MPSAALNSTIPASKWPQTHTLDRVITGIGRQYALPNNEDVKVKWSTHFSSTNYICNMNILYSILVQPMAKQVAGARIV